MDAVNQFVDRAQLLLEHHLPQEVSVPVMTASAIGMIVVGFGVAVLGAKLARGVLTVGFCLLGLAVGVAVSQRLGAPEIVGGLLGAAGVGVVGYLLHRFWVGILAGMLLATVVSGSYGMYNLAPQLDAYEQSHGAMPAVTDAKFTTPDPQTQQSLLNPQFKDWSRGFWNYVNENAPGITRNLSIITPALTLLGLLMGLVAVRFTLIVMSAMVGVVMISSGAAALSHQFRPELYETALQHPGAIGGSFGVLLLASLVLQTMLTRRAKAAPAAAKS